MRQVHLLHRPGPRSPKGRPRRADRLALPVRWRATSRSQTGLVDKHYRGRAVRRRPTGRSAPWPLHRQLVQMTDDPAARPGSPAAPRPAAPSRRPGPHRPATHPAGARTAAPVAVIGEDEMHAGLPQQCLSDRPADRGGGLASAVHAHHDPSFGGVGISGQLLS